ncbi:MAG: hypothetical protein K2J84_04575 [Bacteroidaceae bacterium]|nr:hypothetical protein [Bacteroidaceae bacterium]
MKQSIYLTILTVLSFPLLCIALLLVFSSCDGMRVPVSILQTSMAAFLFYMCFWGCYLIIKKTQKRINYGN